MEESLIKMIYKYIPSTPLFMVGINRTKYLF